MAAGECGTTQEDKHKAGKAATAIEEAGKAGRQTDGEELDFCVERIDRSRRPWSSTADR